eukprot:jgi/Picre1/34841/NNA_002307.t1
MTRPLTLHFHSPCASERRKAAESLSTRRSSSCSSSSGSGGGGGDVELGGEVVGWSSYDDDAEQRLLWETKIVVRICFFEGDNGSIDQVPDV